MDETAMATACWVCGRETHPFYRVDGVPTSSLALYNDSATAQSQPLGVLELGVCSWCGFIQNQAFDMAAVDYTAPYEESQAASPTFQRFVEATLEELIATHELAGKHVFEVGSGKAEWLATACRLGEMTGLGVDPSYVPGRVDSEDVDRFEVVVDFFDAESDWTGDLIACRHTLEHVPGSAEFTGWMVAAAEKTPGSVVFIEVPDTGRILDEGAFWDVYYEHCAYFTKTSLSNLAGVAGMKIADLRTAYDDQYLLLQGSPGEGPDHMNADRIVEAAERFGRAARQQIEVWEKALGGAEGPVALWGATSKTVAFVAATGDRPVAVADINPAKHGSFLPGTGLPVVSPEELVDYSPSLVVAMNPIYRNEIAADLERLGITATLMALGEADGS